MGGLEIASLYGAYAIDTETRRYGERKRERVSRRAGTITFCTTLEYGYSG